MPSPATTFITSKVIPLLGFNKCQNKQTKNTHTHTQLESTHFHGLSIPPDPHRNRHRTPTPPPPPGSSLGQHERATPRAPPSTPSGRGAPPGRPKAAFSAAHCACTASALSAFVSGAAVCAMEPLPEAGGQVGVGQWVVGGRGGSHLLVEGRWAGGSVAGGG